MKRLMLLIVWGVACDGASTPAPSTPSSPQDPWLIQPSIYPTQGTYADLDRDGVVDRLDQCDSSWSDYGRLGLHRALPELRTGCPQVEIPKQCKADVSAPRVLLGPDNELDVAVTPPQLIGSLVERDGELSVLWTFNERSKVLSVDRCPEQMGQLWISARWSGGSVGTLCALSPSPVSLSTSGGLRRVTQWDVQGVPCALDLKSYSSMDREAFGQALQDGQVVFAAKLVITDAVGNVGQHELGAWAWPRGACTVEAQRSADMLETELTSAACGGAQETCAASLSLGEPSFEGYPEGPQVFVSRGGLAKISVPLLVKDRCSEAPLNLYALWRTLDSPGVALDDAVPCLIEGSSGDMKASCLLPWTLWKRSSQNESIKGQLEVVAKDGEQLLTQTTAVELKLP